PEQRQRWHLLEPHAAGVDVADVEIGRAADDHEDEVESLVADAARHRANVDVEVARGFARRHGGGDGGGGRRLSGARRGGCRAVGRRGGGGRGRGGRRGGRLRGARRRRRDRGRR